MNRIIKPLLMVAAMALTLSPSISTEHVQAHPHYEYRASLPLTTARSVTPTLVTPPPAQSDPCRVVDDYNWNSRLAYAICLGESGGRPGAINNRDRHGNWGSGPCRGSLGLMQLGCPWVGYLPGIEHRNDLLDGPANMRAAHALWERSGNSFHPWGAYTNGSYKRHLDRY